MPELPEVQTVRRFLQQVLTKTKKIKSIQIYYPPIIKQPQPTQFCKILSGQAFSNIERYGKFLILQLKTHSIISHLRMEGKYAYYENRPKIEKHDHIQFVMTDGSCLIYSDVRKFGTMHLVLKGEEMSHKVLAKLGPQVNGPDFSTEYFSSICVNKSLPIKQVLLNQDVVCGIGNIYVDQILHRSSVHPETPSSKLSGEQIESIVGASKYIIEKAILNKGTTFKSFSSNNEEGEFQHCLQVYNRKDEACRRCGANIKKIRVAQRGTHYCPKCQIKKH